MCAEKENDLLFCKYSYEVDYVYLTLKKADEKSCYMYCDVADNRRIFMVFIFRF